MADLILKNKTCLITGASGAIGGAIANKLSSLGANVILTGTNKKKIDDCYKEIVSFLKKKKINLIGSK